MRAVDSVAAHGGLISAHALVRAVRAHCLARQSQWLGDEGLADADERPVASDLLIGPLCDEGLREAAGVRTIALLAQVRQRSLRDFLH